MPVFYRNRVIGFVANVAHHNDIGGSSNPYAREHYEEGLSIPIVKLVHQGTEDRSVREMIKANVRSPEITLGDLRAQMAALQSGAAKICEFLEEERFEDLEGISEEIIGRSETAMRESIRRLLPEGRYESEVFADGFEELLRIRATIEVKEGTVHVDYSGTSAQVDKAINSVMIYTYAYSAYALKCILDPNMPNNDGSIRPIRVTAPEGSLVNPRRPAAVWGRHITGHYFPAVILNALSKAIPERVMAESGSCPIWSAYFRAKSDRGRDLFSVFFMNGGHGAHPTHDGAHALSFPTNVSNTPIEMFENLMPLLISRKELIRDSCGAGRFRGGCGQEISFRVLSEQGVQISFRNERIRNPAAGMMGGSAGQRGRILLNGVEIPGKTSTMLKQDDVISFFTPGGGGMFPPMERVPGLTEQDLRNGIISPEYAVSCRKR
jgi:N-methylhydantoinase B